MIIICSYKFMHANLEIHHHNNIIVGQTTLKPRTHVIKTTSKLPFFTMKGKGQIYYFGVLWSSWERRLGAGKRSEAMGLRRKDLAAICRAPNGLCCEFSRRGADEQAILF